MEAAAAEGAGPAAVALAPLPSPAPAPGARAALGRTRAGAQRRAGSLSRSARRGAAGRPGRRLLGWQVSGSLLVSGCGRGEPRAPSAAPPLPSRSRARRAVWGGVGGVSLRGKLGEQVHNRLLSDGGTRTPDSVGEKGRPCWRAGKYQAVRKPRFRGVSGEKGPSLSGHYLLTVPFCMSALLTNDSFYSH